MGAEVEEVRLRIWKAHSGASAADVSVPELHRRVGSLHVIRDTGDHIRPLRYSYYTTITGWGVPPKV